MEKEKRLRKNEDFNKVYKYGKNFWNKNFTIIIRRNSLENSRVGFSLSKKYGKAVIRNKTKRKMREITRINFDLIKQGYDIVLIPKKNTIDMEYAQMNKSLRNLFVFAFKGYD